MNPWLAPKRVTWKELREKAEGHGYPSSFGDTAMTPGKNLGLLMGCRFPCLGWAQGVLAAAPGAVDQAQEPGWGHSYPSTQVLVFLWHLPCHKKPCRVYIFFFFFNLFNIFKPLHRQPQSQIPAQRSVENWPCTCNLKPALPGWRASCCATNEGFRGLFFFYILF